MGQEKHRGRFKQGGVAGGDSMQETLLGRGRALHSQKPN